MSITLAISLSSEYPDRSLIEILSLVFGITSSKIWFIIPGYDNKPEPSLRRATIGKGQPKFQLTSV